MTMTERQLQGPAFPDDDGSAEPRLAAALAAYAVAAGNDEYVAALAVLQSARVLVPVVAVLGEVEVDEHGLAHDKSSDMAAVLTQTPDGRRGLLAFTSTEALAAWNPEARPVPVAARTAAQAAVQEGAAALVVDLAGPTRFIVDGDSLRALAAGYTLARVGDGLAWLQADGPSDGDSPPDAR